MSKDYNIKNIAGARVASLKKKVTNDRVNKIESVPFDISNDKVKEVLSNSDFLRLRGVLGHKLSTEGRACVGLIPFRDSYVVDVMKVITVDMIGKFEQDVVATSGAVEIVNGQEYPVYTRYSYIDGKPALTRFIMLEGKKDEDPTKEQLQEPIFFDCEDLPVEVFWNNYERVDDFTHAEVTSDLERLNEIDMDYVNQYNLAKTMPFFNTTFTDNDPSAETNSLQKGRGYLEESGVNAALGAGTQMIPATAAMTHIVGSIQFLEDDIYKKLGLKRDILGGNNKHTIEVLTTDETTLETIENIRILREQHYNQLMKKIVDLVGGSDVEIILILSVVEQAKWRFFEAQISGEEAKAVNMEEPTEEVEEEPVDEDVEDEEIVEEETDEEVVEEDDDAESEEETTDEEEPVAEEEEEKEEEA